MYDLSPKVVDFEKNPAMYDYKDVYWVKVKFTDPDTGKDLIGDFKISTWFNASSDIERDIGERRMNFVVATAGRKL